MNNDELSVKELYLKLSYHSRRGMIVDFCRKFDLSESSWKKRYHNMSGLSFSEEERSWAEAYVNQKLGKTAVA